MRSRVFAISSVMIGTLLSLYVVFFKQEGGSVNYVPSVVELTGPWLVAGAILVSLKWYRGIACGGIPMLLFEVACYYSVFINPTSSTAPLLYVVKPVLQIVFLGIGSFLGWLIDKRIKTLANSHG